MDEILEKYLDKNNINYKKHEHEAVHTVEESDKILGKLPYTHTKNLFLKGKKFYLVCIKAEKRLDIKKLESLLNEKKLKFSSADELKSVLNLLPGSVSIFALVKNSDVDLILDSDLFYAENTGFHPNMNTATLELTHENLEKFVNSLKNKVLIIEL